MNVSYVQSVIDMCVIYMCVITHPHDVFMCVPWLIRTCAVSGLRGTYAMPFAYISIAG